MALIIGAIGFIIIMITLQLFQVSTCKTDHYGIEKLKLGHFVWICPSLFLWFWMRLTGSLAMPLFLASWNLKSLIRKSHFYKTSTEDWGLVPSVSVGFVRLLAGLWLPYINEPPPPCAGELYPRVNLWFFSIMAATAGGLVPQSNAWFCIQVLPTNDRNYRSCCAG